MRLILKHHELDYYSYLKMLTLVVRSPPYLVAE
jgi:hypothetical protein